MGIYITLASFTDQGIRNVKESPQRAEVVRGMASKCDVTIREIFWTLGQYDLVVILESQDEASVTAFGLSIGALGNVRTQTLRAFSADEMKQIISKMVQP